MPHHLNKLTAVSVPRIKQRGLYSDGGGLYLRVTPTGGKFWAFRFMLHGKAREMGLGAFHALTLAQAREKAIENRKLLSDGIDPIQARDAVAKQAKLAAARTKTFRQCAEAYIEAHKAGWRNEKHAWQWENTLERFAHPIFGDLPVQDIDVTLVMKALEQKKTEFSKGENLWTAMPETASRLRGRIELVLDWATAREYRTGDNPARWRGLLDNLLPKLSKAKRIVHQPALPYEKVGDFMTALKEQSGTAAQALAFTILTAARSGETLGMTWDEFDVEKELWTILAHRTKAAREHRVPLSSAALRILKTQLAELNQDTDKGKDKKSQYVFGGRGHNKPLSHMAMRVVLQRMNRTDITVHGFRSSFRDWCAEQTNFPREIAEAALAHITGDSVESAYKRTDFFDKRRQMMEEWSKYCVTPSAKGSPKTPS